MNTVPETIENKNPESEVLLSQEFNDGDPGHDNAGMSDQKETGIVDNVTEVKTLCNSTSSPLSTIRLGLQTWMVETLACLVAVLALTAIFLTFILHNGRPLPDWPFSISINALISIFSVIFKAALMVPIVECTSNSPDVEAKALALA